jgi:glutathione S-transferase
VDLANETSRANFKKLWPLGKFPVLRDEVKDRTIPESSIIIEYLAQHYPGSTQLVPADADLARQARLRDRFYDLYVQVPMQKIVSDRLRPAGKADPQGVEQARALLQTALGMADQEMETKTWAMGNAFSLADCAAAPALYYANLVMPFGDTHKNVAEYFDRLMERPSFARAVEEAEPYRHLFPS